MSNIATIETFRLRKANDVFAGRRVPEPVLLFDQFWREGELALFFGTHGVGKSFMAVEIGEALARGRPIEGLSMSSKRRRVVYVDLVLSDAQFCYRYSSQGRRGRKNYKFSENFYRECPPDDGDVLEWLRTIVANGKPDVVIIDDLSMVSRTDDGTRQTLELVRELRQMTRRFGISVLVLADSQPYVFNQETAERDLRRRRVLCSYADSVFALSARENGVWRQLVQTRAQSDDIVWTQHSPANFRLRSRDDGFVGFDFVEAPLTEDDRVMICKIKALRDFEEKKKSFRVIADELGITKSRAARLYGKWKPTLERKTVPVAKPEYYQYVSDDGLDVYGFDYNGDYHYEGDTTRSPKAAAAAIASGCRLPDHIVETVKALAEKWADQQEAGWKPAVQLDEPDEPDRGLPARQHPNPETCLSENPDQHSDPTQAGWKPAVQFEGPIRPEASGTFAVQSILDLERDVDHNDAPIYVESRREHDGKPQVWYQFNPRSKTYTRWERTTFTTRGKNVGRSHYLSSPP